VTRTRYALASEIDLLAGRACVLARAPLLGRVLRRGPPIRCGPGTRATCSAVLFGALEAYPPVGTTPGVPGEELVAGYRMFMK
jgi:hypothetical protein